MDPLLESDKHKIHKKLADLQLHIAKELHDSYKSKNQLNALSEEINNYRDEIASEILQNELPRLTFLQKVEQNVSKLKQKLAKLAATVFIAFTIFSCSNWESKQFNSCEEINDAFKNVNYDDIVKKFGEPKKTFEHWNGYGCDGEGLAFEAMWTGVGVNGSDSRIFFKAYELSPGNLSAAYCCTVECE